MQSASGSLRKPSASVSSAGIWGGDSTSTADRVEQVALGSQLPPSEGAAWEAWGLGCREPRARLQALTTLLSARCQAALDFVVEEDLKAHLTCWYIQKYVKENPLPQYLERLQP